MTFYSHCNFHLGDNLIHLHFLRALANQHPEHNFVHRVHECHINELYDAVKDKSNVDLRPIEYGLDVGSVDAWKNAGDYWATHPLQHDYAEFYLVFFAMFAARWGLRSPFVKVSDLLFDYPVLDPGRVSSISTDVLPFGADFLIVNSQPCSGQFMAYNSLDYLNPLILELSTNYEVITTQPVPGVKCTRDYGFHISDIGALSNRCDYLLMVSTGPSWPTFNVWNKSERILLIDNGERVNLMPNTHHARTREEARDILVDMELL